ncbi:MAG: class I SAM-dependent methyltransferase [Flavobacteriaceae bacterium]|nr:class I SAM-dependent methyltransferase [Flavobacteriaceae bacterium]
MLFQIKSYLKFLWYSKNEHAVHSPFVFNIITKCFYDKKNKPQYSILEKYRQSLLANSNSITVIDFGVGSKVFKSNVRSIAQIAKTAGISTKHSRLLFRISNYFKPKSILEIGTSLGLATAALALGNDKTAIITLEGCRETANIAQKQFNEFKLEGINSVLSEFDSYLATIPATEVKFDMIYFDGNHSKKATIAYFEKLLPTITNDSVWIFDDIHWSPDMEEAWNIIKEHSLVTVTIDVFQWGIVFFRREQPKEHFIIRL